MKRLTSRPWLIALAYMATLFALSSRPKLPEPPGFLANDKVQHSLAYAGLAAVLFWAARSSRPKRRLILTALVAVGIASVYGVMDELHQRFVPGRTCSIFDWYADLLGALGGVLITCAVVRYRRR